MKTKDDPAPLKNPKNYYRSKSYNGYKWIGFWDKLHHFQRGDYRTGFTVVSVTEEEIEDDSYKYMIDKGLTRTVHPDDI